MVFRILFPSVLVAVWLAVTVLVRHEAVDAVVACFGLLYLPLLVPALVVVQMRADRADANGLAMCAQAPLALVPLWADLSTGHVGLRGLLDALAETPEPRLFVGALCLIACAIVPVVLALATARGASRGHRLAWLGLYVAVWVPAVVIFDARMFLGGALTCCGLWWFSTGALLRLMVFFAMVPLAVKKT